MKTIKGKLYFVYLLIFMALVGTVFSSYVAVDTNNQHLMLSELLAKQRLNVEKVVLVTTNLSQIRLVDEALFAENKKMTFETIDQGIKNVDEVLDAFKTREYVFDGKNRVLKFTGEFERVFDKAVDEAEVNWMKAQEEIGMLVYTSELSNEYIQMFDEFSF